jgi:hypothetical protein
MSLVAQMVDELAAAGAAPDVIAIAVRALAKAETADAERRRKRAEQKAKERAVARQSRDMSRDKVATVAATSLPKKETSPHTPLKEKTPSLNLFEANASNVDGPVDACDVIEKPKKNFEALKAFGEAWNQLAGALHLPAIDEIKTGSTRERQALARLREMPANGIQELIARIRGSPYLRGEVNSFRVSFDWIIKPSNYQKIMEGNYEDRKVTTLRR